eukprot:359192-Chlamydomonas_euryale.AAC.7
MALCCRADKDAHTHARNDVAVFPAAMKLTSYSRKGDAPLRRPRRLLYVLAAHRPPPTACLQRVPAAFCRVAAACAGRSPPGGCGMFQVPTAAAAGWPPSPSCRRLLDGQPAPAATAAEQPPGPGCRQTTSHAALHELGWRRRRPPLTLGHGAPRLNQCLVNLSRFLAVNAQLRQHGHALCGLPVLSVPRGLLGHPCAVEAGRTAWRHVLCVQRLRAGIEWEKKGVRGSAGAGYTCSACGACSAGGRSKCGMKCGAHVGVWKCVSSWQAVSCRHMDRASSHFIRGTQMVHPGGLTAVDLALWRAVCMRML